MITNETNKYSYNSLQFAKFLNRIGIYLAKRRKT